MVGWILKSVKEEKNDDGLQDFLYNKDEKNLTIPSNRAVPASGRFRILYRPTTEIIDFFEDLDSQMRYGILYEKALKNKNIKTKAEARKLARTSLQRESANVLTVSFSTYDFRPLSIGKLLPLILSRYGIDAKLLITDISKLYDLKNGEAMASVSAQGVV